MKKILSLTLALALLCALLAGCGSKSQGEDILQSPEDGLTDALPNEGKEESAGTEGDNEADEPEAPVQAPEDTQEPEEEAPSAEQDKPTQSQPSQPVSAQPVQTAPAQPEQPAESAPAQPEPTEPEPVQPAGVSVGDIWTAIEAAVELPSMMSLTDDDLSAVYGLDASALESYACNVPLMNVQATEIFVAKAADGQMDTVKAAITARQEALKAIWERYLPEQYELVKNAQVVENGDYILFVVCEDADTVVSTFNDCVNG